MSGAFAELHQDLRDLVGQIIADRYRVDSLLGVGGMAAVFRAHHLGLKRAVALKVLHPNLTANREISARFDREAESASRLDHPNTIQVTDYGSTRAGMKFMVMQLLEGRELGELLVRPLPPVRAVELMLQVFSGLEHAHRQGVVHRDIKPENIFITTGHDGREVVKLVDFGISKIVAGPQGGGHKTSAGLVFGTPAYMSPEQAAGMEADGRADLYAAGIILYQMLAGRLPFDSDDPVALIRMQVGRDAEPLPHFVPPLLAAVVDRLLAKDRERRFQSATEVIQTLESLLPRLEGGRALDGPLPELDIDPGEPLVHVTPPPGSPSGGYAMTPSGRYSPIPVPAASSYPSHPGMMPTPSGSYVTQAEHVAMGTGPHGSFAAPVTGNIQSLPSHARWPLWAGLGGLSIAVIALATVFVVGRMHPPSTGSSANEVQQGEDSGGNALLVSQADPAALAQVDQLILTKEFDKAEELLKPLRDQFPDDPILLWRQGRILASNKRKQSQTLATYGQALSLQPKLLEDRDFYAETYELLRNRRLRDEALDLALQKMGTYGHTFLLELVNDKRSPLDYHDRQRALEELAKSPENDTRVDRKLNMALDLLQAHKSMTPCRAFLKALEEIAAAPDYYFYSRVEKAKMPSKPGPGLAGSLEDDADACAQLELRRQELLTVLGALSPTPETDPETVEEGADEGEIEVLQPPPEEPPPAAPAPKARRSKSSSSSKKSNPDCKKFGAIFNKKCR